MYTFKVPVQGRNIQQVTNLLIVISIFQSSTNCDISLKSVPITLKFSKQQNVIWAEESFSNFINTDSQIMFLTKATQSAEALPGRGIPDVCMTVSAFSLLSHTRYLTRLGSLLQWRKITSGPVLKENINAHTHTRRHHLHTHTSQLKVYTRVCSYVLTKHRDIYELMSLYILE